MRPKKASVGDVLVICGGWGDAVESKSIGTVVKVTAMGSRVGWIKVKNLGEGIPIKWEVPHSSFCTLDEALEVGVGIQWFPKQDDAPPANHYLDRVKELCTKLTAQEAKQLIDFLYKKIN